MGDDNTSCCRLAVWVFNLHVDNGLFYLVVYKELSMKNNRRNDGKKYSCRLGKKVYDMDCYKCEGFDRCFYG